MKEQKKVSVFRNCDFCQPDIPWRKRGEKMSEDGIGGSVQAILHRYNDHPRDRRIRVDEVEHRIEGNSVVCVRCEKYWHKTFIKIFDD